MGTMCSFEISKDQKEINKFADENIMIYNI